MKSSVRILMATTLGVAMTSGSLYSVRDQETTSGHPGAYAKVNGLRMYYEVHGTGEPLLLLTGGTGSLESLAPLLPSLAAKYKVIAPEQMGHGRTADADRPFSYDSMAADTAELLKQLNVGRVDVVGWSDGGVIGLALAMHHAEFVRKLVITGADFHFTGISSSSMNRYRTIKPDEWSAAVREAYARLSPDGAAHWSVVFNKIRQMWLTSPTYTTAQLASITAPTLVIVGDRDTAIRLEHTVQLFQSIPGAQLSVIRRAGHMVPVAKPKEFAEIVLGFLAEPSDRTPQ